MSDADPAYIARADCGCIVAATIDHPRRAGDTAKTVAGWVRDGFAVERTTAGEARSDPYFLTWPCPHDGNHAQARIEVSA